WVWLGFCGCPARLSALVSRNRPRRRAAARGGIVSEARTGKRFPLHLPIKIHKEDTAIETSGMTGDLSAAGVYIRADASLEVGSPVEFEITLSPAARIMLSFSAAAAWCGPTSPTPAPPPETTGASLA